MNFAYLCILLRNYFPIKRESVDEAKNNFTLWLKSPMKTQERLVKVYLAEYCLSLCPQVVRWEWDSWIGSSMIFAQVTHTHTHLFCFFKHTCYNTKPKAASLFNNMVQWKCVLQFSATIWITGQHTKTYTLSESCHILTLYFIGGQLQVMVVSLYEMF